MIKKTLFSLIGTAIVMWHLMSSGYVLTLDMIFGPHVNLVMNTGDLWNTVPIWYVLSLLTTIFGGWFVQKILLVSIFFLLFYLPLHFFKKIFKIENTNNAEYVASLVFAINPFVYERFLAGQWMVLAGYVLLIPFTAYLIEFCREWSYKNGLKLLGVIILIGVISTHILIMSLIVASLAFVVNFVSQNMNRKFNLGFLKMGVLLAVAVLVCSSYWLVPAILSKTSSLATFGPEHWEVFKTAGSGYFGTLGNVLTLHGFWGEHEEWVNRFVLPKDGGWTYGIALVLLYSLVIVGICIGLKDKKIRGRVVVMIGITVLAVIFSCGVGEGIFKNLNLWIFDHVYFWRGFRDSEKWSALIALGYALFAGLGSMKILSYFKQAKNKRIALYILLAIPLLYTPMMLFGFAGQLKTAQYPNSWSEVNNVLKKDKNCRAIFLPWHQYYSLKFNDDILTANVSGNYFDCDIVRGQNMELGSIVSQGGNGPEYDTIEGLVTDNNANPDATIQSLRQMGIKYIIFTSDIAGEDQYGYPFLGSKYSQNVIDRGDILLFSIF